MHQFLKWHDSLSIDSFAISLYDLIQICGCCLDAKLCPTICNPTDCSTSGSSVLHYLPEFAPMEFNILLSRGKAFFMILSTQLRQISPCLTHSTPIHFLLSTLFILYPQLDMLQRFHFLVHKLGKTSHPPCVKPRVPAIRIIQTAYTKHIYIIKKFIPRLCLQKEEQTDGIHCSTLILIVAIIWSVSNQLIGI